MCLLAQEQKQTNLAWCSNRVGIKKKKSFVKKLDPDIIINKCPRFYDLKSNKRYIFFMKSSIKRQLSSQKYLVQSYIYIHKICACNAFIIFYVNIYQLSLKQVKVFNNFFSFIYQSHSFDSRQIGQFSPRLIILKLYKTRFV